MGDLKCVWEIPALLGEGPLWAASENAVYWVDIYSNNVHRLSLADDRRQTWTFEEPITSLSLRKEGGFICTVRNGFAFLDLEGRKLKPIVMPEVDLPGNRFNDGKVDSNGRYWAGTMDFDGQLETGSFYRLGPDLTLRKVDTNYIITNGPTFSADGKTLYHTDSAKGIVYAFDLHENGDVSNKRPFIQLQYDSEGAPDGMTVDSENCIWLSHFGGGRVTRYSPEGEIIQVISMPVPNVTSCTFAGPELDTLYITTARLNIKEEDLPRYSLAGSLFSCKPGVKGLPTPLFGG